MAPTAYSEVAVVDSQQSMLAMATVALLEAVKTTGEGPNEYALYLLELLEVSAKIDELSEIKAAAKQSAVSSEAKKWQELSLLTLQFCADGLHEQQRTLVRHVRDMAGKGASLSLSAVTAITAGAGTTDLPKMTSILATLPSMSDLAPELTERGLPVPKGGSVPPPKPSAASGPVTPPKRVAKGKAKAKQQVSKQQEKLESKIVVQQQHPRVSQPLSAHAAEFHPVSGPAQVALASPSPNFDSYGDEE